MSPVILSNTTYSLLNKKQFGTEGDCWCLYLDTTLDVVNLPSHYQLPCIEEIQPGAYLNTHCGLWGVWTLYPSIAKKSSNQNPQRNLKAWRTPR